MQNAVGFKVAYMKKICIHNYIYIYIDICFPNLKLKIHIEAPLKLIATAFQKYMQIMVASRRKKGGDWNSE